MKYLKKIFESSNLNSMTNEELEEKLYWLRIEYSEIFNELYQISSILKSRKESSYEELTKDWPESIFDLDKSQLSWVLESSHDFVDKRIDISKKYLEQLKGLFFSGTNQETGQYNFNIITSEWSDLEDSDIDEKKEMLKNLEFVANNLKPVDIDGEKAVKFGVLFDTSSSNYNLFYYKKNKIVIKGGYSSTPIKTKTLEEAIDYLVEYDNDEFSDN